MTWKSQQQHRIFVYYMFTSCLMQNCFSQNGLVVHGGVEWMYGHGSKCFLIALYEKWQANGWNKSLKKFYVRISDPIKHCSWTMSHGALKSPWTSRSIWNEDRLGIESVMSYYILYYMAMARRTQLTIVCFFFLSRISVDRCWWEQCVHQR